MTVESQGGWGRKGPRGPSGPPQPQQGHPEQAQPHVQVALGPPKKGDRSPSGQPVPGFGHAQSKKVFPDEHKELPEFQSVPIAFWPVPGRECLCYDCSL